MAGYAGLVLLLFCFLHLAVGQHTTTSFPGAPEQPRCVEEVVTQVTFRNQT